MLFVVFIFLEPGCLTVTSSKAANHQHPKLTVSTHKFYGTGISSFVNALPLDLHDCYLLHTLIKVRILSHSIIKVYFIVMCHFTSGLHTQSTHRLIYRGLHGIHACSSSPTICLPVSIQITCILKAVLVSNPQGHMLHSTLWPPMITENSLYQL